MDPDLRSRLQAFARDCVYHGDMTPMAQRMLDSILELYPDEESKPLTDAAPDSAVGVVAEAMRQMWGRESVGIKLLMRARQIVEALQHAGHLP